MHDGKMQCSDPTGAVAAKEVVEQPGGKRRRRKSRVSERTDDWEMTPDLILEKIFSYLGTRERLNSALTCQRWFECMFTSAKVWQTLDFDERKFARRKLNMASRRMQYEIESRRVQLCLKTVGRFFRKIVVKPTSNFYNLYKFLQILASFLSFFDEYPMPVCYSFEFTFACSARVHRSNEVAGENQGANNDGPNGGPFIDEMYVFGTGGQILETTRTLLGAFHNLTHVALCNLLLETEDAECLLEPLVIGCSESLRSLNLRNCSKQPCAVRDVFAFSQLHTLTLSAANIDDDFVIRIVLELTNLRTLAIETDQFAVLETPRVDSATWQFLKSQTDAAKRPVRVRLSVTGTFRTEMHTPDGAPVDCVAFCSPYAYLSDSCALRIADRYCETLETFAQFGLPRRISNGHRRHKASFHERIDTALVSLVRVCSHLRTLVICERISTCTLLVLATELQRHNVNATLNYVASRFRNCSGSPSANEGEDDAQTIEIASARRIFVRRNALVKRFDWPRRSDWDAVYYDWLKRASRSYDETQREVAELLNYDFHFLSDRQFVALTLENLHV